MSLVFFTICSKNYLPVARACLGSIAKYHHNAKLFLFLCDAVDQGYDPALEEFEVIDISNVAVPDLEDLKIRYDVTEINTAVKPWCFLHLFTMGFGGVIYMDPDTWVLSELVEVFDLLSEGVDAIVTPHILQPITDGESPDEFSMLRVGVFNLGFLALSRSPEPIAFLRWWGEKLRLQGGVDLDAGLFTDQRWCDLLPCFVEQTTILRHTGYNVAYWNLMQRKIGIRDGHWRAGNDLLRFAHFSGASFTNEAVFSKHQTRFTTQNLEGMGALYSSYRAAVNHARRPSEAELSYSWNMGPNGEPLSRAFRQLYSKRVAPRGFSATGITTSSPFTAAFQAALAPAAEVKAIAGLPFDKLMFEVWNRPDLRSAFDVSSYAGRLGFLQWFLTRGVVEDPGLIPHADKILERVDPKLRSKVSSGRRRVTFGEALLRWAPVARRLYRRLPPHIRFAVRDRLFEFAGRRLRSKKKLDWAKASRPGDLVDGALLIGYVRGELGMGEHVRMTAAALEASSAPFGMFNYDLGVSASQRDHRFDSHLTARAKYRANILHINADQLTQVFDAVGADAFEGRVNIGYPAWELELLPAEWIAPLERLDEIWAPSRFIQSAISSAVNVPVLWMPLAVELAAHYDKFTRENFNLPSGKFLFLFTFDFASFVARKNPQGVLSAFKQAFPRETDSGPMLIIKTISGSEHPEALKRLNRAASREDIRIIDGVFDANAVHGLINVCDCYVSLHRSEGFGRGLAEAMLLGKPVICTAYSGNLDFTLPETSRLIEFELTPVVEGEYPYSHGAVWAKPSEAAAARAMRELVDYPLDGLALGARARNFIIENHSAKAVGRRYVEQLRKLGCLDANDTLPAALKLGDKIERVQ